eukprot:782120-Alexandrium_andersonii.AAC.1
MLRGDGGALHKLLVEEVRELVGCVLLEAPHLHVGNLALGLLRVDHRGGSLAMHLGSGRDQAEDTGLAELTLHAVVLPVEGVCA